MLLAILVAAPLTGISQDWAYYRLGKSTVCGMAAVEGTAVQYGICKDEPPERIKALKFTLPAAKREIAIKNGKLLARVTLDRPDKGAGLQRSACLGETDRHCDKPDVLGKFLPRAADLDIVRVQGGKETVVANTRGMPRSIKAMYASPDGTKVVVVYVGERVLRDKTASPLIDEVLGVNLTSKRDSAHASAH